MWWFSIFGAVERVGSVFGVRNTNQRFRFVAAVVEGGFEGGLLRGLWMGGEGWVYKLDVVSFKRWRLRLKLDGVCTRTGSTSEGNTNCLPLA